MKKIYTKFNSFVDLKIKDKIDKRIFLKQLKVILNKENKNFSLSKNEKKIFDQILVDLFKPTKKNCTGFSLKQNVLEEINNEY